MKQILQYYFNITYFKGHMALQIKCIEPIKKQPEPIYGEHGVPDFKILDKKPEERIKEILNIEKRLSEGQRYLMSIKDGGLFTKIVPKKTISRLCNMLNKKQKNITFKLAT